MPSRLRRGSGGGAALVRGSERPRRGTPGGWDARRSRGEQSAPRAFPVGAAEGGARTHPREKVGAAEWGRPGKPVVLEFAPCRELGS